MSITSSNLLIFTSSFVNGIGVVEINSSKVSSIILNIKLINSFELPELLQSAIAL